MIAIVLYGFRESLRRKMFLVVLVLTAIFLGLYGYGVDAAFKDAESFAGPGQQSLDPKALAGATIFGLALFAIIFLGGVLAVFLTLNVVRGDAEAGLLQPLVVRPIGRAQLLFARFAGAALACAGVRAGRVLRGARHHRLGGLVAARPDHRPGARGGRRRW